MLLGILIPAAIIGVLALVAALFFQGRAAGGLDTSPRAFLRLYLYLGSLAAILVLVYGLSLTGSGLIATANAEFAYGRPPEPARLAAPPGAPTPPPEVVEKERQRPGAQEQNERRRQENLLQGITTAIAGAFFWAVHWWGRRQLETREERGGLLRRGYYLIGTGIFGVASIVLLPLAVYRVLRYFLIPPSTFEFRGDVGETIASAAVVVPVWLIYLWLVLREFRTRDAAPIA